MATTPRTARNTETIVREFIASGAGLTTKFYACDPNKKTSIMVVKNGESATVSISFDLRAEVAEDADIGDYLTDQELALYGEVSTGTTDYIAGDNKALSGVKVVTTPVSSNVQISIIQYE